MEGDLLGRLRSNPALRVRLQRSDGFESVLAAVQEEAERGDSEALLLRPVIQAAVAASFRAMNLALAKLVDFNFSNSRVFSVSAFLARFDAIYTLNQDLLLELHCKRHAEAVLTFRL